MSDIDYDEILERPDVREKLGTERARRAEIGEALVEHDGPDVIIDRRWFVWRRGALVEAKRRRAATRKSPIT